jgi:hypothetical protein
MARMTLSVLDAWLILYVNFLTMDERGWSVPELMNFNNSYSFAHDNTPFRKLPAPTRSLREQLEVRCEYLLP